MAQGSDDRVPRTSRVSPRPLIRPTVELAVSINHSIREHDEWFDEPDEIGRLEIALDAIAASEDPIEASATLAFRIATGAQAFGEGNKRTALLLARWILDRNGMRGALILPLKTAKSPTFSSEPPLGRMCISNWLTWSDLEQTHCPHRTHCE